MRRAALVAIVHLVASCVALDEDEAAYKAKIPLIFAAGEGDGAAVESLLAGGADVMQRSKDGETALHVAAVRGDLRTVRALLAAGAEVDARTPPGSTIFMTPSMWATYHGHTEMVRMLLEAGADPMAEDEKGKSLLKMAQEAGMAAIEEMLRAAMRADPRPAAYLTVELEPQGTHKLWVAGVDAGSPQVSTKLFAPGNTLGTGLWECTPGSWSITRSNTESFLVLKGRATLTNADGGLRVELAAGVWHTTPAGWSGRWEVHQTVRKVFVLTP